MRKDTLQLLVPALLAVAAAVALWIYWAASNRDERPAATTPAETAAPADAGTRQGPLHPLPEPQDAGYRRPTLRPVPPLDQSDEYFKLEVVDLFGERLAPALAESQLIERLVASVDNLPREHVAQRTRPVTGVDGQFIVEEPDAAGEFRLGPENYGRYDALIDMLAEADMFAAADAYRRFYPLLQKAYVNLGYPDGYFNDRAVEVIDHLLATPDVVDAPKLVRPHVLYEYADAELESLSAGQKLLIRIGSGHRRTVEDRLREFRMLIVGTVPPGRDEPGGASSGDAQATSPGDP